MTRTRDALEQLARPLRRVSAVGVAFGALAATALVFALAAWSLRFGLVGPARAVPVTWAIALGAAAVVVQRAWRDRRRLTTRGVAGTLESRGTARSGALLALLDHAADGTSAGLVALADTKGAADVSIGGPAGLAPVAARLRRRAVLLVLLALLAGGALAAAGPTRGSVALLFHPRSALALLTAPVTLRAEPASVDRGGRVTLHLQAVGQRSATLWRRAPGQSWMSTGVPLDSAGRALMPVGPVDSDLYFRLSAGNRGSDTVHVRVRLPAFLGSLRVMAQYPPYLGLEDEPIPVDADPVLLPAGTRLVTEGEASLPLDDAAWMLGARRHVLAPAGRVFRGGFVPMTSGEYTLTLRSADGAQLAGEPVRLPLLVVPDSAPVVDVPVPGVDTLAPADLRIPLVIDARDDHGLARVEIVSTAANARPVVRELDLAGGTPSRALLEHVLDLSARDLAPGDTVRYLVRAWDTSPDRRRGESREFLIVVPTGAEHRQARREATREARRQLDSLVAAGRRLERQTEDLARAPARPSDRRGSPESGMGFDEAQRAEAAARSQENLLREAESLQRTLEALEEAARRGEAGDSALARRLAEVSEQLRRALSPELREKLTELQRALQQLDPESTRQALRELAEMQQVLRQALERSRELFRRAAVEGELATLAQDARDLSEEQGAWNEQVTVAESGLAAAQEQMLADRADSLAGRLAETASQMDDAGARERTAEAAEQAERAAGRMRDAANAARQGRRQEARGLGQQARADMENVQRETDAQRARQQEQWRQEVLDALDRALAETARLSRQQLTVSEGYRRGALAQVRGEQATVEESVTRLVRQVADLSGQNALVPPQIAVALAVARRRMAGAREAVSTGSPNLREAADHAGEAVDALNVAAFGLVRAREDVAGSASASGLAEAMERMTQLARQQGQLSQQAGGLLPLGGTPSLEQQLRQLALDQRGLARELERMRAEGRLPAAGELGEEARELARRLEAGQLDPETVARQERLFRRMLDAGRTLEGEEEDERKERQSETPGDTEPRLPAALRQRLGEGAIRFPGWEELQRLSPEERRLVTEYFRRLTGGGGS